MIVHMVYTHSSKCTEHMLHVIVTALVGVHTYVHTCFSYYVGKLYAKTHTVWLL